jgi:hypothetical protein
MSARGRGIPAIGMAILGALLLACASEGTAWAQEVVMVPYEPLTPDALIRMSPAELDWLYRSSCAGMMPRGKVKGYVILSPGSERAAATARVARLWWQGKVFRDDGTTAVNRFAGIRIVEGSTYIAQSWMDGQPSLILDYQHTSRIYRNVRDEIRQVGPNLYLGAMFDRTLPEPTLRMYFILETDY